MADGAGASRPAGLGDPLAARLRDAVSLWESRLRAESAPGPRAPALDRDAALARLRAELAAFRDDEAAVRHRLDLEAAEARMWEERATDALLVGREDVARHALERHGWHVEAMRVTMEELALIEEAVDEYAAALFRLAVGPPLAVEADDGPTP